MPRSLAVCVDDFGYHEGVNTACAELAALGRVSAISCMVDGPAWRRGVMALRDLPPSTEVGLHLNLTEPSPKAEFREPLRRLIGAAYSGQLSRQTITREITRQLQEFESDTGRLPDFIDGHQHVHQLPVVRDALLCVLEEHARAHRPWLRSTLPAPSWTTPGLSWREIAKARLIGRLGAHRLLVAAGALGYRHNARLLGVYGFGGTREGYLARLGAWLSCAGDRDLLMCHPAADGPASDPILAARRREYEVLGGQASAECFEASRVTIRPLACC